MLGPTTSNLVLMGQCRYLCAQNVSANFCPRVAHWALHVTDIVPMLIDEGF